MDRPLKNNKTNADQVSQEKRVHPTSKVRDPLQNPYDVLEIPKGSSPEAIQEAYRLLAFVWHPDRFSAKSSLKAKATAKFIAINAAYRALEASKTSSDPVRRTASKSQQRLPKAHQRSKNWHPILAVAIGSIFFILAFLVEIQPGRRNLMSAITNETQSTHFDRKEVTTTPILSGKHNHIGDDGLQITGAVPLGFVRTIPTSWPR